MKYLAFMTAVCFSTVPCFAKIDLWTNTESKIGQTVELKEHRTQHCMRAKDSLGLMERTGKIKSLSDCRIIGIDNRGWIAIRISNKRKLIGPEGRIIPKTDKMEIVNFLTENRAPVKLVVEDSSDTGKSVTGADSLAFSYCTETGEILDARFDQVSTFNDGVAAVRIGKSVGFIGLDGKFLPNSKMVECQFIQGVSQGSLAACRDGLWGYLDMRGNWLIKPTFSTAEPFHYDFAMVSSHTPTKTVDNSNGITYIDKTGKQFAQQFYSGKSFEEGYAAVSVLSKEKKATPLWGVIDRKGQWVVEPKYSRIGPLIGSTRLLYDKKLVGIFSNGKITLQPRYPHIGEFSEGLASFQEPGNKNFGFLDRDGKIIVPAKFAFAGTFSEGLAAVSIFPAKTGDQCKIGFINKKGAISIAPKFGDLDVSAEFNQEFVQFHDGLCLIPDRPYRLGKYSKSGFGFINKSGQWIDQKVITFAYPFKMGQALVQYYPNSGR